MYTRPPGVGSIVDPAPHHTAQRVESVKYRKTMSRSARMMTVRSRRWGSVVMGGEPFVTESDGVVDEGLGAPARVPHAASGASARRPTSLRASGQRQRGPRA